MNTEIEGVILAGGESKRMGTNKSLIKLHTKPLIKASPHNDVPIIEAIINSMRLKPESHTFDLSDSQPAVVRFMSHTGG